MPETAVDLDHRPVFGKNHIRFSGKRLVVQFVTKSFGVQCFSDSELRFGVLALDAGHHPASFVRAYYISHSFEEKVVWITLFTSSSGVPSLL